MAAQIIFALIGDMLGARQRWVEGTVRVHHGPGTGLEDLYVEHFWRANGRWRIDRSDGLSFSEHVGVESRSQINGRFERGPSAGVGRFAAGRLLEPINALIWGRPGEDWRLTGELDQVHEHRWRLWLEHVEGGYPEHTGYAVVEERTGIVHELHTGFSTLTIESISTENAAGRDEAWLILQP